jgi:hypothetical protein
MSYPPHAKLNGTLILESNLKWQRTVLKRGGGEMKKEVMSPIGRLVGFTSSRKNLADTRRRACDVRLSRQFGLLSNNDLGPSLFLAQPWEKYTLCRNAMVDGHRPDT